MRTVSLEEQWTGARIRVGAQFEAAIDRQTPEINLIRLADRAALQAAMEELPPHLLEVVLLCDLEEMKYKEMPRCSTFRLVR